MRIILNIILLIILVSCKPEDECENINTKIEQWNQKLTLHPRAYNFLLDSIYLAYSKAEKIECKQSLGMAIEFKLWYFTRLCNANEAIDYVSQLDEKRFAYPSKKEMYLNLYRAMKAWSRFEDNYLDFLLDSTSSFFRHLVWFEKSRTRLAEPPEVLSRLNSSLMMWYFAIFMK